MKEPKPRRITARAAAETALREAGQPLRIEELVRRMQVLGWTTKSADPCAPVIPMLYGKHRAVFEKTAPMTFALRQAAAGRLPKKKERPSNLADLFENLAQELAEQFDEGLIDLPEVLARGGAVHAQYGGKLHRGFAVPDGWSDAQVAKAVRECNAVIRERAGLAAEQPEAAGGVVAELKGIQALAQELGVAVEKIMDLRVAGHSLDAIRTIARKILA